MLPSISFGTGRRTQTQSSVRPWEGQDSKWKSGSISNRNRGREANTRGERTKRICIRRSSEAPQGSFCPLTKTYHGSRLIVHVEAITYILLPSFLFRPPLFNGFLGN